MPSSDVLMSMQTKVLGDWDELFCPERGAENVVIIDTLQQIKARCDECGKETVIVRDGCNTLFLDKIKEPRSNDPELLPNEYLINGRLPLIQDRFSQRPLPSG